MECNRTWNDPLTSYVAAFEKLLEVDGRYYCRRDDTLDGSTWQSCWISSHGA